MPLDTLNPVETLNPLDSLTILPANNLRLPDALTIKHGPAQLLGRFVVAADRATRRRGVTLRVRYDFEALLDLNRHYVARELWYPLIEAFDPRYTDLTPENAYWIAGEDENGEIILANACRIMDWTGSNLKEQAWSLYYGRNEGQPSVVTADAGETITGVVAMGGAAWCRPDYRGKQLSYITGRTHKAYACARWPVDWSFCLIGINNVQRGLAGTWGHEHLGYSVFYPGSAFGELVVAYSSTAHFYADIADLMANAAVFEPSDFASSSTPTGLEQSVTNTSSDWVFQGSISRS